MVTRPVSVMYRHGAWSKEHRVRSLGLHSALCALPLAYSRNGHRYRNLFGSGLFGQDLH